MLFYSDIMMRDLIRNYKLLLQRKSDTESETESQPLMSSSSSHGFGSTNEYGLKNDSDTDTEADRATKKQAATISPIQIQKPNRQFLYKSSYQHPDFEVYSHDGDDYNTDILTGEKSPSGKNGAPVNYDYRDPELPETNSSLVTIFAIWNTTVGTSLLSMSWGIEKTGLFPAIFINIAIAAICLYTTYTILKVNEKHGVIGQNGEVCDLCRALIGRWAEILAKIFSLVVLIGANIVYWILMSNFFYHSVQFFYGILLHLDDTPISNTSVLCPKNETIVQITNSTTNQSAFSRIWDLYSTVPVILGLIMFPMLNWKSPTFFTKFNSLGTFSVLYLIVFVAAKAGIWGINMPDWDIVFYMKPTFCALSGMLSLSYFIHNIIISIMRNNKHQEHNGRDLTIAFGLVTFTYLFIGVVFYICFPLPKFCIEDNILNNFNKYDVLTILARILLLFQLFTVFPLISYMLRNDVFANINMIFKNYRFGEFTYPRVMTLNFLILTICISFACFLPRIGTLIRYTGALSGLVYIFMLPSLLKIASLKKEGRLTTPKLIFHAAIMIVGSFNLLLQFFISDK
ncbi:sodium-coupled neutral amino acid transporter 9-like [Tribolium madens]|uniref:sodium-coupled neutral amino acid transporter 9-like n=1 Tax=Tribolium madens TaxID=41895 RepID=UPI001CF763BC|nr:sodium-coupled neutral amino acid transporter 9-like [Tribolium madens]